MLLLSRDKGTSGQGNFFCPGTKGQRDKLKILSRDRTGRDSLSKSGTGRGTGQSLFFCQNLVQDRTITIFCCFRTFLSCFRMSFSYFLFTLEGYFVLGRPGTEGQAQNLAMGQDGPGQPLKIFQRDRTGRDSLSKSGTGRGTGQGNVFCLGTKRQRDVPSLGNPISR